jgi:hypothetical protein
MKRFAVVATLVGVSLAALETTSLAQKAPEMKSILAGRKVEQAFKGQADVEFIPSSRKNGEIVVTTMKLRNLSGGPISRLKVEETWFDKGGSPVGSSNSVLPKMLEPGAVETLTIETPWSAKMNGNSWTFTHANGTVKPHKVAKFADAAPPAAKAPAAKKK